MANVNVTYNNRVEYIMEHADFNSITIEEPLGWETDEKEYARVDGYDGIFTKFSNKLTFVGDGAEFAKMIYNIYGANTDLILKRRERHPQTNRWELSYLGYLDLMTYDYQDNQVKLKFNTSGLQELIKTRESEKIEIERLDTIDGDVLPELPTELVYQEGRRIFLKSNFTQSEFNNEVVSSVESNAGNTRDQTIALPIEIKTNQHQVIAQSPYYQAIGSENKGDIGMMFFLNIDRDRTFNFSLSGSLDAFFTQYENVQWCQYYVCLSIYENGLDFDLKTRINLDTLDSGVDIPENKDFAYPPFTKPMSFTYNNANLELKAGESVAFEALLKSDMYVDNNAGVRVNATNVNVDFTIEEDSYFKPTTTKTVLAHELTERTIQIKTGRSDAFYSDALGRVDIGYDADGVDTGALNGFSHGLWIRGFDKLPESEDNKYKAFTTSFKDVIEHHKAVWNLSIGIEKIGFKERLRLEKREFFFNKNVTIHVGEYDSDLKKWVYPKVNKLKRTVSTDYLYSGLSLGYEKGADNEEAMGLDEYNTKSTFNTAFTKAKNIYEAVSKFIAGSYPDEFIRRKPKEDYPTTDHSNDTEIFVKDLKRGLTEVFEERKWADDFEEIPTGTFSPETATNLRLSPFNIMLRHGWNIVSGLKDVTKYIRYGSSEGNSKLTTKLIGSNAYSENGNIIVSELQSARYLPEWIEFEYEVDFNMIKQVEGTSVILGKSIPNFYGLVQFRNEENVLEKGFLFNLKPNGNGKWKLLKANI